MSKLYLSQVWKVGNTYSNYKLYLLRILFILIKFFEILTLHVYTRNLLDLKYKGELLKL